jgi:hypothetical protein
LLVRNRQHQPAAVHVGTVLLNAVVDHLVAALTIIVLPLILAIHVAASQPEACMPQLRGVDRNHTASLVLVARFVKRPALGIRLITNEPLDGEKTSPSLQNTLPNLVRSLPRLVACAMTGLPLPASTKTPRANWSVSSLRVVL